MKNISNLLLLGGAIMISSASIGSAQQGDGNLSAADVRRLFVDKEVIHEGDGKFESSFFYYGSKGFYDSHNGRVADGGRYSIENDGRVCWTRKGNISGCFQYYRVKGALRVRNTTNGGDIGRVTVKPWTPPKP